MRKSNRATTMPRSTNATRQSKPVFDITMCTSISPPHTRSKARWTRRSPLWRKPAASIQSHDEMENRAFAELAEAVRRPAQGGAARGVSETRKIAAILVSDVVGYSRLAGADEDRTLSRLRGLRSDLI